MEQKKISIEEYRERKSDKLKIALANDPEAKPRPLSIDQVKKQPKSQPMRKTIKKRGGVLVKIRQELAEWRRIKTIATDNKQIRQINDKIQQLIIQRIHHKKNKYNNIKKKQ